MSDDNVMYDSPLEFMHEVAEKKGECVAQSVLPLGDGTYRCACSCENWDVIAPDREKGLEMAREHTGTLVSS
ncbi:hypothetical protein [Cryptosporangium aurantiacum]|uniref:Uncharacterized protein n=1 Tax=Cryptosporangium aurantiacum TaxID=134849 RepID=A0A1M7R4U4_9ACTN|nr:hypothetical protein [Cryptosporangium aurantiacum]SHN40025.1 hypothetical protein SAMN05443668_106410 [Cryptosporangium aurantiacum]